MSIRPIDMSAPVARSMEISQANAAHGRPAVQNDQFAKQMQKEVRKDEQSVRNLDKAEKNQVNKDDSRKQQGKGKQENKEQGQQPKNKEAAAALAAYKSMSMVDIKI